jgi:hypothetical protein
MHDTPTVTPNVAPTRPRPAAASALLASAFVLVALIVLQAGRLGEARADMVSSAGGLSVLTADTGSEESLFVLDSRKEELSVYRVVNQNSLELYRRYELPRVFGDARSKALGRK